MESPRPSHTMLRLLNSLKSSNVTLRLILINVAVMIAVAIVTFITSLSGNTVNLATSYLDLPAAIGLFVRPWSLITYMFTHTDVWHCVFNMIWLYWLGRICEELISGRRLLLLYIVGGIGGGLTFITGSLIWPSTTSFFLEGASASIMAVMAMLACSVPNMRLNMLFLGMIKIKWIALAILIIYGLGLTGSNMSAHLAHLGGLATGAIWALTSRLFRPRYNKIPTRRLSESEARAELDSLLDKVRQSGYASLSSYERRRLVELSHNV